MPRFTQMDFCGETSQRLQVIIANKCGEHPLTPFSKVASKPKFNRLLNEYVNSLGDDWDAVILKDFNLIVNEEILNDNFKAEEISCSGLTTTKTLLMTSEQYEIDKENPAFNKDYFNIEIVEKPENILSSNNINESVLS
jgi:hypothetical protein